MNGDKGSDQPDLRQVFTESCQMFRHHALMRYYTLAACGLFTAGLIAAWYQKDRPVQKHEAIILGLVGISILIAALVTEIRLSAARAHFAQQCECLGRAIDPRAEWSEKTGIYGLRICGSLKPADFFFSATGVGNRLCGLGSANDRGVAWPVLESP